MNIDYKIKNCSHCNSSNYSILGNENQAYGLVSIKPDNNIDYNTLLPVIAVVCKDCGHIDLIHINAKAIQNNQ